MFQKPFKTNQRPAKPPCQRHVILWVSETIQNEPETCQTLSNTHVMSKCLRNYPKRNRNMMSNPLFSTQVISTGFRSYSKRTKQLSTPLSNTHFMSRYFRNYSKRTTYVLNFLSKTHAVLNVLETIQNESETCRTPCQTRM